MHSSFERSNRREKFYPSNHEGGFVACQDGRSWSVLAEWFAECAPAGFCVQAHVGHRQGGELLLIIICSQYFSFVPLSRSLNETQSSGDGREDCFSLSWESSSDFCDDVQRGAHMEQNRDGGDNDCCCA